MKNLSVGKKLGVGFGIIIVLILVILAVTTVTSLTRNSQLAEINNITDMQDEANLLLQDVFSARVELRSIFTLTEYDQEYTLAMQYLKSAQGRITALDQYVENMGATEDAATYAAANVAIADGLKALFAAMEDIVYTDTVVAEKTTDMETASTVMAEASTALVHVFEERVISSLTGEPDQTRSLLQTVMFPGYTFSEDIDSMRIVSAEYAESLDAQLVSEIDIMLAQIDTDLGVLKALLATPEGKAATTLVGESIESYKESLRAVEAATVASDISISEAKATLDELINVLSTGTAAITESVTLALNDLTATSMTVMITLMAVVIITIILAVISALVITRAITRPVGKMQVVMRQVAQTGNLHFSPAIRDDIIKESRAKDEIGQSLKELATFVDRMTYIGDCLEKVAEKDLTLEIEKVGPEDTMGNALGSMLENLNYMFGEINAASGQVSVGSKQIADGAQALASGATEQAASIQQLSSSISEIAVQTKTNAEMAGQAAEVSGHVREKAEVGVKQMDGMIDAVRAINESSQNISKVIKVIDDIAFQTNILALNAAVEAARAGQHGKGFSVVAEEVRSLAAKSTEAAKETSIMIEDSIEKAELGAKIAHETAESINEIILGVNESTDLVHHIAEASEHQSTAISEVNLGIDQIAQVVQQNSATAEQSAAASEELNGQATVLQSMVGEFELKDRALNSPAHASREQLPEYRDDTYGASYSKY